MKSSKGFFDLEIVIMISLLSLTFTWFVCLDLHQRLQFHEDKEILQKLKETHRSNRRGARSWKGQDFHSKFGRMNVVLKIKKDEAELRKILNKPDNDDEEIIKKPFIVTHIPAPPKSSTIRGPSPYKDSLHPEIFIDFGGR